MLPRRLETTLVSCSRQRLPRNARFYVAPTKRVQNPALATATTHETPQFNSELLSYAPHRPTYVVPVAEEHAAHFGRLLAVISVCLHNLDDVPRAQQALQKLKDQGADSDHLSPELYNSFIEAYLELAKTDSSWVAQATELYQSMQEWTTSTYALMLLTCLRHGEDSHVTTAGLLKSMSTQGISMSELLADRVFHSSEEVTLIIRKLAESAADAKKLDVVRELGVIAAAGRDLPESDVMPVIKGEAVPFNIDNLRRHLVTVALNRQLLPDDLVRRQRLLEESVYQAEVERMKHEHQSLNQMGLIKEMDASKSIKSIHDYISKWCPPLQDRIVADIQELREKEANSSRKDEEALSPFLSKVSAETLALITINEVIRLPGSKGIVAGMPTVTACLAVGGAAESEHVLRVKAKAFRNMPVAASAKPGQFNPRSREGMIELRERRMLARKNEDSEGWRKSWTRETKLKVGAMLVTALTQTATVTRTGNDPVTGKPAPAEEHEAFQHGYEKIDSKNIGVIRLNPIIADRMALDPPPVHPSQLPMLTPPLPWTSHKQGGYYYSKTYIMRFKESEEQKQAIKDATKRGSMEQIFEALNILGNTPWVINRGVFDVVLKVWNSGKQFLKIPPAKIEAEEPVRDPDEEDHKARYRQMYQHRDWVVQSANNHSDRSSINYKIEIAKSFIDDTFYIPHNLDFRGRAYPLPPHLNHIGNDLSRGIMAFGVKKPLGVKGLRWLKIHLSNLWGYDKASFQHREEFTMEHLDDVIDSAENPLEGRQWWTTAGDPWQCLSACMELNAALKLSDPTTFMSGLPVHQDGTCNGLQHYAALGGDAQGASQVNLLASDKPSDVYTHVANMVEAVILQDMYAGAKYAPMLTGKIGRKVVKQTVMTTVYGVTFIGARAQIEKQLKDKDIVPREHLMGASSYLAKTTLTCIGDLFTSASSIQDWLGLSARLVARSLPYHAIPKALEHQHRAKQLQAKKAAKKSGKTVNHMDVEAWTKPEAQEVISPQHLKTFQRTSVAWDTPAGLPVVQPYRTDRYKQVSTKLQAVTLAVNAVDSEVKAQKQASAFPPNFIHSLDATHMLMTVQECHRQGMTFASVHDSYWTHACDIDDMSKVIRDMFIELHEDGRVLKDLREQFVERYRDHWLPAVHLTSTSLRTALNKAGVKIKVNLEGSKTLSQINDLLDVDEDAEASDSSSAVLETTNPELLAHLQAGEEAEAAAILGNHKKAIGSMTGDEEKRLTALLLQDVVNPNRGFAARDLAGKYINIASLIPPLPEMGTFKVADISKSDYFFS